MANPIVVEIDAQDNSKKTLKDFANNLKSANTEAAKAAESFRKTGQGAKNFGDAVRAPSKSVGEFGKGLKEVAEGVNELNRAWRDVVGPAANAAGTGLLLGRAYSNLDKSQRQAVRSALGWKNAVKQSDRAAIALYNSAGILDKAIAGVNKSTEALNKTFKVAANRANILFGITTAAILAKELADVVRETSKFAAAAKEQARFLEISRGALAGQTLAYEAIGKSQEDVIETYNRLDDVLLGAIDGNQDYVDLLEEVGIASDDLANVGLEEVFSRVKSAVDDGTLSYKQAASILGQDLTVAIDDVRDRQEALTNDGVDAAAWWQENWEGAFDWWDNVKLKAKELTFSIVSGTAVDGKRTGPPGSDTGVQLPGFDLFGNIINPVTGDVVQTLNRSGTPAPEAGGPGSAAYFGPQVGFGLPEGSPTDLRGAFLDAVSNANPGVSLNELLSGIASGEVFDAVSSSGGGGGGSSGSSFDVSGRAFARAEEDGLRRALSTAIRSEDFSLAREQASDLHAFRTTQADLLETAGEQFLARQQADFALQDSLLDISSREQRILDDIKDADMAAAKELIQVRKELEEHNARELAKANEAIGGAQARLITGSQLGPQYTQALNDLRVETDSLRAGAALLPPGQRAGQIAAIDAYEQQQIAQLNQQFLSHPLTSPDPTTAGSRGGAGTLQNRSLIINVYNAGSVLAQQDLSDAIFDAIRTGDESGVLLSG